MKDGRYMQTEPVDGLEEKQCMDLVDSLTVFWQSIIMKTVVLRKEPTERCDR